MRIVQLPDRYKPESCAVGRVTFGPDGRQLVAQTGFLYQRRCTPETVHVVDRSSGAVHTDATRQTNWHHPAVSQDGRFAASAIHWSRGAVVVEIRENGQLRGFRLGNDGDGTAWLAFAPDGRLYAAINRESMSGQRPGVYAELMRCDPARACEAFDRPDAPRSYAFPRQPLGLEPPSILDGAFERVARFECAIEHDVPPAFTPDGRWLALWPALGPPLALDTADGSTRPIPRKGRDTQSRASYRLALDARGERAAVLGAGALWCQPLDGAKGWRSKRELGYLTDAAFHPDGRSVLAVNRAGHAHRLDAITGRPLATWDWKVGLLLCVACSADGTTAAAGGAGGNLVLWDLD